MACVTNASEVFTWGRDYSGRLGHGDESDRFTPKRVDALVGLGVNANQVACGRFHTAGVCTKDDHVYALLVWEVLDN
jgi:alpha-tubulin suppressor-like RCC1 family protein